MAGDKKGFRVELLTFFNIALFISAASALVRGLKIN